MDYKNNLSSRLHDEVLLLVVVATLLALGLAALLLLQHGLLILTMSVHCRRLPSQQQWSLKQPLTRLKRVSRSVLSVIQCPA
jgi:hypothetical protein